MGGGGLGARGVAVSGAAPVDGPAIDSSRTWAAALRWGFDRALTQDARRITCVDADFGAWPWNDEALLDAIAGWLRLPMRRLVLLAAGYDAVPRQHPRFNAWRRNWGHAMDAWQAPAEMAADLPGLLLGDQGTVVHLIDAEHWRGRARVDVRTAHIWQERVDVVLQRSERSFAVKPLGL